MVVGRTLTLRRFFLAASMPFLIAADTSLALPVPKPTIFAPGSPITTRAEKLRFLPPLTTFVTRLIETTCSLRFKVLASIRFVVGVAAMVKTPILLLARHRPGPSRAYDKDSLRDRTQPC